MPGAEQLKAWLESLEAAAPEPEELVVMLAYAAGQAVATAHVPQHAFGGATMR